MFKSLVPVLFTFSLLWGCVRISIAKEACGEGESKRGSLNLSIQSQRNKSGEWVTTFTTSRDSEDSSNVIKLDVNHTVVECGGRKLVQVHGILRDTPVVDQCLNKLLFHSVFAKNIVISESGRKATRKNAASDAHYAAVFTSRPLKREELFEVLIDSKITNWHDQFSVGITATHPSNVVFSTIMRLQKKETWLVYGNDVFHNDSKVKSNYGRDLDKLQVGERVGVVVKNNGALHILVNGIDQGPAMDNIPSVVYGFVDVTANVVSVTITSSGCP